MLIIVDKKVPDQARRKLTEYGNLIELETSGITYDGTNMGNWTPKLSQKCKECSDEHENF